MKKKIHKILLGFLCLLFTQSTQAQVWYRAEMQSVRGYNNDCDFGTNEEGEFECRLSDNINYGAWSYTGCMECDGNMNNGTGVTCAKTNLFRDQSYTTANAVRFENRGQEDDGLSNCDWNNDCVDDWGDQHNITLSSIPQNAWQSYTRTRSSRWQQTYRLMWNYAVPITGTASLTATGIVSDGYGEVNNYANYQDGTLTIYPVNSCQRVRVTFNAFSTESNYDYVYIYNGNSASAPLLSQSSGSTLPASQVSTAKDGSLTVRFTSDVSAVFSGFRFTITNEDYPTPAGDPALFGSNIWNVYGYCNNNIDLSGTVYRGFYTESSESFNSANRWTGSPSDASGWAGNALRDDYHTVVSKRQGFTSGYYTLSIPTHDDDIRVYINGVNVFEHIGGCCDAHNCVWAGTLNASSTMEVRHIDGTGGSQQAISLTPTINPTTYGSNQWNVYAYNGSNFNNYFGYYTTNRTSEFNIGSDGMGAASNPSAITGGTVNGATVGAYAGCGLGNDTWSISAKRQGFPCAVYNVNMVGHDDGYVLNIDYDGNGTVDFTSSGGCCDVANGTKWTGVLTSASKVEIQLQEGSGNAYLDVDFVNITPAIGGGTISGITNGVTICNNTDPGSFSTSGVASGGTVGYINGGSYTYQWESSITSSSAGFTNISAATSQTYNPGNLTATTWFRRKVTDMCGNTTYSNVIQVIVIPYPSGGSIATVNICSGTVGTISITGVSNATQYSWVLPASFSGISTTASINVTAPTVSNGTTYTINAYPQNVSGGTTCTGTVVMGTISVYGTSITVGAPSGSSPLTQCSGGDPVPLSVTTPTGGNGSYSYQWQQSAGCTGTWINAVAQSGGSTSLTFDPPVLTLPTTSMCYRLRVTDGCGNVAYSALQTYSIVADPAAPSATKSPNVATVCAGQVLTLTGATQNGGGTGACNIEYATSTNGGTSYSAWSTTLPSFAATGTDNRIKIRTNCNGLGCDVSSEVTYTWAVVPVVSLIPSGTNVSCFGGTNGTASVLASGGTGAYTYSWYSGGSGNSLSGLSAGTYTVLVSSATCSATASYTVTQPTLLVANTCTSHDLCQVGAGSVKIEVSGGTPPYSVSRSPALGAFSPANTIATSGGSTFINGLSNGTTLNITVTDANGCVKP